MSTKLPLEGKKKTYNNMREINQSSNKKGMIKREEDSLVSEREKEGGWKGERVGEMW